MSAVAQESTEQIEASIDVAVREDLIPIFIMGKKYDVPEHLDHSKGF